MWQQTNLGFQHSSRRQEVGTGESSERKLSASVAHTTENMKPPSQISQNPRIRHIPEAYDISTWWHTQAHTPETTCTIHMCDGHIYQLKYNNYVKHKLLQKNAKIHFQCLHLCLCVPLVSVLPRWSRRNKKLRCDFAGHLSGSCQTVKIFSHCQTGSRSES